MNVESPELEASVVELTPQPSVAVRVTQPMTEVDLGELFQTQLPNVTDRIADLGGVPAGAPYGRYHQFGPDVVDIEIGVPVAAPVANLRPVAECEPGEVGSSELPGGRAVVAVHRGSYEGLGAIYDQLHDWIHGAGYEEGPGPWESYVDDPSETDDPGQLRTEVVWPLG